MSWWFGSSLYSPGLLPLPHAVSHSTQHNAITSGRQSTNPAILKFSLIIYYMFHLYAAKLWMCAKHLYSWLALQQVADGVGAKPAKPASSGIGTYTIAHSLTKTHSFHPHVQIRHQNQQKNPQKFHKSWVWWITGIRLACIGDEVCQSACQCINSTVQRSSQQ
jgi:hypothetical protein